VAVAISGTGETVSSMRAPGLTCRSKAQNASMSARTSPWRKLRKAWACGSKLPANVPGATG
jgi:hypothetical protein